MATTIFDKPLDHDVSEKLNTGNVYNGLDQESSGYALDARQGKALNEAIATINGTKDQTISSGDLNSYTSTGLWRIGNISALTHIPAGTGTTGILYVMVMSGYILQDFINNTRRSSRFSYDGGSTWTDWQTVALNSNLTRIYKKEFTVTTNASGNIAFSLASGQVVPIGVKSNTVNRIITFYNANSYVYIHVTNESGSAIANEQITFTAFYIYINDALVE